MKSRATNAQDSGLRFMITIALRGLGTQGGLSSYPCSASCLSRETVLSDFPHSRHTRLALGVISPQNGHILFNRTSRASGLNIARNRPKDSHTEASCRRREGR